MVYCLDCVEYLGKRCVRQGHDVKGVVLRPRDERANDSETNISLGSAVGELLGYQGRKEHLKYHRHRRNKSHHGVLE